jgi:mono/diheme cytochrome c family protein/predicted  nucleic acid-binding Zn-ribbon protein
MPKPPESLYSLQKTTFWFAVVSLVLLGSVAAMVVHDYRREWKSWQKKFIALKAAKLKAEADRAAAAVDPKELERLEGEVRAAEAEARQKRRERKALDARLGGLDVEVVKARTRLQDLRQYLDSYRYFYEEHAGKDDRRAGKYRRRMDALEPKIAEAKLRLEAAERDREALAAEIEAGDRRRGEARQALAALVRERDRARRAFERARPTLAQEVLNAPMVDFIAPSIRIQQIVLENLYDDYHFTRVQKVDRCTTCHLGIDQPGFEDAPQPFRTHPRADLFVAGGSPHPAETFGCTVCHGGNGHSVSFVDSAHAPSDPEEEREWKKRHRWRTLEKWDAKMLPLPHIEASCATCHAGATWVPEAPRLNRGRKLAETFGCFNCHLVKGFENRWKAGPDLRSVKSKLDRDWIVRWLQDPKAFRPQTRMPRVFHLANMDSPEDRRLSLAAIEGIAAYLMAHSDALDLAPPPVPGDPARGEALVKTVGCLGCHSLDGIPGGDHGPFLSGLGSKVRADWLYAWLKDPRHVSPDTRMPSLRLSDSEAADITSYLLGLRAPDFEKQKVPPASEDAVEELALAYLTQKMRLEEARAELAPLDAEGRRVLVGRQTIAQQGCFGCHAIKGFEDQKPIGTELSREGSKDLHQFDFGRVHPEHSRQGWLFAKLKNPRIFDEGKVKPYLDKLRMPDFGFTDEEAGALTTFLLSLKGDYVPLEMQKRPDARSERLERGRVLVSRFNCQGCHTLDGKEGTLRELAADPAEAPPRLDGEGLKVQEPWLHAFLREPSVIRPWLKVRMPTFGFTDEEAADLVHYFAAHAGTDVSYQAAAVPPSTPERLEAGKVLFEKLQCAKCHEMSAASAALGASFLAPDLKLAKDRLKPDWVVEWMKDPQGLEEGTMMPTFFPEGATPLPDLLGGGYLEQIRAIRDYLYRYQVPAAADERPAE